MVLRSGTTSDYWTGEGDTLGGSFSSDNCSSGIYIDDGVSLPNLEEFAWFCSTNNLYGYETGTKEVGQLRTNGFGLYDLLGNVSEMTSDLKGCHLRGEWCDSSIFDVRVKRGGAFNNNPSDLNTTDFISGTSNFVANLIGALYLWHSSHV